MNRRGFFQTVIILVITLIFLVIVVSIIAETFDVVWNSNKDSAKKQLHLFSDAIVSVGMGKDEFVSNSMSLRLDKNFAIVVFNSADFRTADNNGGWPIWPSPDVNKGYALIPPSDCYDDKLKPETFSPCVCLYEGMPKFVLEVLTGESHSENPILSDYYNADLKSSNFWHEVDDKVVECVVLPRTDPPLAVYTLAWKPGQDSLVNVGGACMVFNKGLSDRFNGVDETVSHKLLLNQGLLGSFEFNDVYGVGPVVDSPEYVRQPWYLHPVEFFGLNQLVAVPGIGNDGKVEKKPVNACGLYSFELTKVKTESNTNVVVSRSNLEHFFKRSLYKEKVCPANSVKCSEFGVPPEMPELQGLSAQFRIGPVDSLHCDGIENCDGFVWSGGSEPLWMNERDFSAYLQSLRGRSCYVLEYQYTVLNQVPSDVMRKCLIVDDSSADPLFFASDPLYLVYSHLSTPCSGQPGTLPVCLYNYELECQVGCLDSSNMAVLSQSVAQSYLSTGVLARVDVD